MLFCHFFRRKIFFLKVLSDILLDHDSFFVSIFYDTWADPPISSHSGSPCPNLQLQKSFFPQTLHNILHSPHHRALWAPSSSFYIVENEVYIYLLHNDVKEKCKFMGNLVPALQGGHTVFLKKKGGNHFFGKDRPGDFLLEKIKQADIFLIKNMKNSQSSKSKSKSKSK